jgi:hypothetical protein
MSMLAVFGSNHANGTMRMLERLDFFREEAAEAYQRSK